jgi:hypothetical protein
MVYCLNANKACHDNPLEQPELRFRVLGSGSEKRLASLTGLLD